MGMFDSVYVAHTLIKKVLEEAKEDILLEVVGEYCSFQSKDLDNCLTDFYIKEDGSFCWEKQEYVYAEPATVEWQTHKWGPAKPVGDPQYITDMRTAYISFYDFYYTDEERIFVTFTAHVKEGKLNEPIVIQSIERTNLEEEAIKHKKAREEWNKVTSAWQWKLATFMHDIRFRIQRFLYPLSNKFNLLDSYLRKEAKKGTSLE